MNRRERLEIIQQGDEAHQRSMGARHQKGPWLYKAKVKSGVRATRNVEDTFTSIPHLMGEMVMRHAREDERFSVFAIARIMKAGLISHSEDI